MCLESIEELGGLSGLSTNFLLRDTFTNKDSQNS